MLLISLSGFTDNSDYFRREGVLELRVDGGGGGGGTVFRFKEEGGLVKKDGVFSLPHFIRDGACHDITKSADSQTNISFSENDRIIAETAQKRLSNEWLQTEGLRKLKVFEKNSN